MEIYRNARNSGSVFAQWIKGISLANGDYIWIAEADDLSEPTFLEEVMKGFDDPDVVLSYCASKVIDWEGRILEDPYHYSIEGIDAEKWRHPYVNDGLDEIRNVFVIRNNIHNGSAAVFKKIDIQPIQKELQNFTIAGDWFLYTYLLRRGKIAYTPKTLNLWRRHSGSQSSRGSGNLAHYRELVRMQESIFDQYAPIPPTSWARAIQHRHEALEWLKIYQEGIEKYLFIISTPQSGCERLIRLLNSSDGMMIRGRNEQALFSLYKSFEAGKNTHQYHSDHANKLWSGVDKIDPYRFRDRLCNAFVQEVLRPDPGCRIAGYCETDLFYLPLHTLEGFIKFLLESFVNARILFLHRDPVAISQSGWYADCPRSELLPKLQRFDAWMSKIHHNHPSQTLLLDEHQNDEVLLEQSLRFINTP